MPLRDMATSTGAFGFIRTMGGTVGVSVGQAIFTGVRKHHQYLCCRNANLPLVLDSRLQTAQHS